MAAIFGVAAPSPRVFADTNGLFLVAVGIGYYWPYRDPRGAQWYLWLMGPGLKGAGAIAFLADYFVRHSPASFLLFAASDGTLAVLTLCAGARRDSRQIRPQRATPESTMSAAPGDHDRGRPRAIVRSRQRAVGAHRSPRSPRTKIAGAHG